MEIKARKAQGVTKATRLVAQKKALGGFAAQTIAQIMKYGLEILQQSPQENDWQNRPILYSNPSSTNDYTGAEREGYQNDSYRGEGNGEGGSGDDNNDTGGGDDDTGADLVQS
ncbi:hypothetical protein MMC22_002299 [Lobaria immixta]|nr:hypothetical protein [Lobaria immixta]